MSGSSPRDLLCMNAQLCFLSTSWCMHLAQADTGLSCDNVNCCSWLEQYYKYFEIQGGLTPKLHFKIKLKLKKIWYNLSHLMFVIFNFVSLFLFPITLSICIKSQIIGSKKVFNEPETPSLKTKIVYLKSLSLAITYPHK